MGTDQLVIVRGREQRLPVSFKDSETAEVCDRRGPADTQTESVERQHADEAVMLDLARLRAGHWLRLGDVLPRHQFLRELQRERLRTDRSGTPLSVAVLRAQERNVSVDDLLDVVVATKREIDLVGMLGDDSVALLLPDTAAQGAERLMQKVRERAGGVAYTATIRTYPDQLYSDLIAEGRTDDLYPVLPEEALVARKDRYSLKRVIDVLGAVAALLALSPLIAATAAAVALSSPGPVIFRQVRIGKGGRPFVFYKFRSMYCNNDDRIHREYVASLIKGDLTSVNQGDASKPMYKMKSDPRITRVGAFIRRTSLDELPQLFNVLKGDMSLVGPRPALMYEVEKYQSWHLRRILEVRPGITGHWQVEGRSKTSFDDMVRLDLRYVRNCSLLLDLKILLKTVKVVLQDDGAR